VGLPDEEQFPENFIGHNLEPFRRILDKNKSGT